ncbi:MAG: hypothetical protein IKY34_04705 [Ruminiclostridium sp.]|nr:hypothetical protein [Ruminiclostridium sp.]
MQAYTNRFNVAMNFDGSEVMINFFQSVPQVPEDAANAVVAEMPTENIPVANLVMTGQSAHNLLAALQGILNAPHENIEE